MKNKFIYSFLLFLLIFVSFGKTDFNYVYAMPTYKAMCVMEANSGKILNEYNSNLQLPMASTTKIITAIVTIENCDNFDRIITVNNNAVGIEGTSIYLKKDEKISIDNLLYGLILASGNDCAVALAYEIGGSEENFVKMMNDFAKKLDLKNTHFANPHGLDAKEHYTSASDLAKITSYALKNDKFMKLVSTKKYNFGNDDKNMRYLKHKNKLLFSQDGCIGVKTGFTDNAGRCLVNACDHNGMRIISVVLNCGPMFQECGKLTNFVIENYAMKELIKPYDYVGVVPIVNGDKMEISASTIKGLKLLIKKCEEDKYRVEYNLCDSIEAPIKSGTIVGTVKVYYNNKNIFTDNLYAIEESENIDLKYMLDNIIKNWYY